MKELATLSTTEQPYHALLNRFLATGLSRSLEQVRQFAPLVPDEVRQRSWNQLSYALRADDLWQPARTLLLALSPKMEQAGFREEWIAYLSAGIHAAGVQNDFEAIGEFALQIAQLQRMMSDYEPAISWLQTSLESFRKVHDSGGQARALNELAWVEHLRRHYSEAADAVEQALALLAEDDPERGMCYRVQGMIAIYQRQWQVAEESHRKSLAAFRQQGDERKAAWAMQNLALALRGQKRFDEAIDLFQQAASTMQKVGDLYHWMIVQLNLGTTYYFDNQLNEAVHCYRQAESYAIQFHDRLRLADVYVNLGLVYLAQQASVSALHSFQRSIQLFEELGIQDMVINSMDGVAMCYLAQQHYDEAVQVLEQAFALLPNILHGPRYRYLHTSLSKHWQEAKTGQSTTIVAQADVI